MPETSLYFLKFGLLVLIYAVLALLIRALVRDLPMPATAAARAAPPPPAPVPSAPGWSLEAVQGPERLDGGPRYPITGELILGRGPSCQIRVLDPFASTAHARLTPRADGLLLEDLSSTNGTFRGAEAIRGPVCLGEGDTFSIGDVTFAVVRVREG